MSDWQDDLQQLRREYQASRDAANQAWSRWEPHLATEPDPKTSNRGHAGDPSVAFREVEAAEGAAAAAWTAVVQHVRSERS